MILALIVLLIVLAFAGGVAVHPALFALLIIAFVLFVVSSRRGVP